MARPKLDPQIGLEREIQRFWGKVDRTGDDDCWLWKGGSLRDEYGQFHPYGQRRKVQAHRYAYELIVGSIPEGLTLDHLCRNRRCVNPRHLEPVTHRVNILRGEGASARHARITACPHGHRYDDENTYIRFDGRRVCRQCQKKWHREKMRRRRARIKEQS